MCVCVCIWVLGAVGCCWLGCGVRALQSMLCPMWGRTRAMHATSHAPACCLLGAAVSCCVLLGGAGCCWVLLGAAGWVVGCVRCNPHSVPCGAGRVRCIPRPAPLGAAGLGAVGCGMVRPPKGQDCCLVLLGAATCCWVWRGPLRSIELAVEEGGKLTKNLTTFT